MSEHMSQGKNETLAEFNKLLVAHLPLLRQQALSLTRNKADAEDLLQSAVASALGAYTSFCAGTDFKAWISRIQRNRFLSNIRQRRMHTELGSVPEGMLGRNGGQEDHLRFKELSHHLTRLPQDQREILLMVSVDGVSYEAASQELGIPVGTLKCRVFRARAQLEAWTSSGEPITARIAKPKPLKPARAPAPVRAVVPPPVLHNAISAGLLATLEPLNHSFAVAALPKDLPALPMAAIPAAALPMDSAALLFA